MEKTPELGEECDEWRKRKALGIWRKRKTDRKKKRKR